MTRHLTFANICSALALTVALTTGTAYAATTIRSKDIVNGQVKKADLGRNAVTSAKIRNGQVRLPDLGAGSVTGAKVADGTLGTADLAAGAVATATLQDGSVSLGKMQANSVGASAIAANSVGASELAPNAADGSNVVNNSLSFADIVGGGATGDISLPAGAVPAGVCENYSVAISGAAPGDAVVFSVQEELPDGILVYGTRVITANTVDTLVCNFTGGAMPAVDDVAVRVATFR